MCTIIVTAHWTQGRGDVCITDTHTHTSGRGNESWQTRFRHVKSCDYATTGHINIFLWLENSINSSVYSFCIKFVKYIFNCSVVCVHCSVFVHFALILKKKQVTRSGATTIDYS